MITAEFFKKQGALNGFQIKGHAGFSAKGNDIVCASVSSAVQLVANTITECFMIKAEVTVLNDRIQLQLPEYNSNGATLIEGLLLHLTVISEDYKGTIKIKTSEV